MSATFDDHFDDHPKYAECSAAEMGVHSCAITYANRNLTDGFIPRVWPTRRFGRSGSEAAKELVRRGIWRQHDDGRYEVVGYLDHNPTRSEVLADRARAAELKAKAGQAGGIKSGQARRAKLRADVAAAKSPKPHTSREANAKQNIEADANGVEAAGTNGVEAETNENEARSDLIRSDQISPLPPKGEPGLDAECEPEKSSGVHPIPTSVMRMHGSLFADTYTRVVAETLDAPWSLPTKQRGTIERVVATHCPVDARPKPERWLADTLRAFLTVSQVSPTLWGSHGPDGFERWLNAGRPGPSVKPGFARPDPAPPPYHGPVKSSAPIDLDPVAPPPKVSPFAKGGA